MGVRGSAAGALLCLLLACQSSPASGGDVGFDWDEYDECIEDVLDLWNPSHEDLAQAYGDCCDMDTPEVAIDCAVPLAHSLAQLGEEKEAIKWLQEVRAHYADTPVDTEDEGLLALGMQELVQLLSQAPDGGAATARDVLGEVTGFLPPALHNLEALLANQTAPAFAARREAEAVAGEGGQPGVTLDDVDDCLQEAEDLEDREPWNIRGQLAAHEACCAPVFEMMATRYRGTDQSVWCQTTIGIHLVDLGRYEEADALFVAANREMFARGDQPGESEANFLHTLGTQLILYRNWPARGRQAAADLFFRCKAELPYIRWEFAEQPVDEYYEGLRAMPWWQPTGHDWLPTEAIEAAYPQIRAEFDAFLAAAPAFQLESDHSLVDGGAWREFLLFEDGLMNETSCAHMPTACAVFGGIKQSTGYRAGRPLEGQVTVFQLTPGTHLRPHTGSANDRLTMHLGLIIPDGVTIRVANTTGGWQEGKVILFDDSFEHEVWHNGTSPRYVIYATIHHPDRIDPSELEVGPYDGGINLPAARSLHAETGHDEL